MRGTTTVLLCSILPGAGSLGVTSFFSSIFSTTSVASDDDPHTKLCLQHHGFGWCEARDSLWEVLVHREPDGDPPDEKEEDDYDKFLLRNGMKTCMSANLETSVIEIVNCQNALYWTVNKDAFEYSSNALVVSPYGHDDLCANVGEDGAFRLVDCDVEEGEMLQLPTTTTTSSSTSEVRLLKGKKKKKKKKKKDKKKKDKKKKKKKGKKNSTEAPSMAPSSLPTSSPSFKPSSKPSVTPSAEPSGEPSFMPSLMPTKTPSSSPTSLPTSSPSMMPTPSPSAEPSVAPTATPSSEPSNLPTAKPSATPSAELSAAPSVSPKPSATPSVHPTATPSATASPTESLMPTTKPSASIAPSLAPTTSTAPSNTPTLEILTTRIAMAFSNIEPTELVANTNELAAFEANFIEFMNEILRESEGLELVDVTVTNLVTDPIGFPVLMDIAAQATADRRRDLSLAYSVDGTSKRTMAIPANLYNLITDATESNPSAFAETMTGDPNATVVNVDPPTNSPSNQPSFVPSDLPSDVPSDAPSDVPSHLPSMIPSDIPSDVPSDV
eukprot:CAMPEP_0196806550 /NCGR_PEP_ID=MMETSP1362-20130617/6443_1 /TAXON_ID=163516 /ORGANISM="Leptocylindrus danicus, Strain CCMP1856" /LENGTH=552 /DNA_ID=CAMNT_0042180065 /DNA_START=216 /DNA_END=1870 /DNA_ORIENTATION=+